MPPETPSAPAIEAPAPAEEVRDAPVVLPQSSGVPEWEYQHQPRVVLYEALTARVGHRDALVWQPPALALTAQAFLLTIALGHDSSPIARILAACLGLCVTYLSIQLMLKHRMYLLNDMYTMVALERDMTTPTTSIDYDTQHAYMTKYEDLAPHMKRKKGLTKYASVHVWIWGLIVFALINLFLLMFAALDMAGVPCAEWLGGDASCVLAL